MILELQKFTTGKQNKIIKSRFELQNLTEMCWRNPESIKFTVLEEPVKV